MTSGCTATDFPPLRCSKPAREPVGKICFDIESEECLFYVTPDENVVNVSEAYAELETIESSFSLVSASEQQVTGSVVRIDTPAIGFGENPEEKQFVIVCRA